jgi:hypothetical protein
VAAGAGCVPHAARAAATVSAPMPVMNCRRERYSCSGVISDEGILIMALAFVYMFTHRIVRYNDSKRMLQNDNVVLKYSFTDSDRRSATPGIDL